MNKTHIYTIGKIVLLFLMTGLTMAAKAEPKAAPASPVVTKAEADSAYARQQYQQAIRCYEQLLKSGVNADIYYNLGNAYYRTDDFTHAVLNYERALLLDPGDKDIRFNLQLARSKTIDKITPESEMFFVTWYRSLTNLMSVDGWATTALVCLALAVVLFLLYLFSDAIWRRKAGFFGSLSMIVLFVFSNVFAFQQNKILSERAGAIVMSGAAPVKSTPAANGTDLFILHEGTKVSITDEFSNQWMKIRVSDGKEGWIAAKDIERI